VQLNPSVVLGGTGEVADFQELRDWLKVQLREVEARTAGDFFTATKISTLVQRILYQRRSTLKLLVIRVVVAGINPDAERILGTVSVRGTTLEDDYIVAGIARHLKVR
jgi:20S proteasome alpha/beta subunit